MNRGAGIINRRRRERRELLENIDLKQNGKKLGYKRGQVGMGKAEEISLRAINAFTYKMDRTSINMKFRTMMIESQTDYFTQKDYQLRTNYLNALKENYNVNDIQDVINHIENMDIEDFLNQFYEDPGEFEFVYPPDLEKYQTYVNRLKSKWNPNKQPKKNKTYKKVVVKKK